MCIGQYCSSDFGQEVFRGWMFFGILIHGCEIKASNNMCKTTADCELIYDWLLETCNDIFAHGVMYKCRQHVVVTECH